jgi:hypothetical protein
MRYQQVYDRSLFTNLDVSLIYVTTLGFSLAYHARPIYYGDWTVTNMQVNLSTTSRNASNLSTNFANNVGPDDTVVFGPRAYSFHGDYLASLELLLFDKPFRYDPRLGNLLLDVRVFAPSGLPSSPFSFTQLTAFSSPTDECSRVWAPDVNAATAPSYAFDSIALDTVLQFSPVPTLTNYTRASGNPATNYIIIDWPTQPPGFVLQQSALIDPGAVWETVTNAVRDPTASWQRYYFPANSAPPRTFYRLLWPEGQ